MTVFLFLIQTAPDQSVGTGGGVSREGFPMKNRDKIRGKPPAQSCGINSVMLCEGHARITNCPKSKRPENSGRLRSIPGGIRTSIS